MQPDSGYTLIECMIVLVILSLCSVFAIGRFDHFIERNRTRADTHRIYEALQYARNLAMAQGQAIQFCGSQDKQHCDANWDQSQLLIDQDGKMLQAFPHLASHHHLTFHGFLNNHSLIFLPSGLSNQNGTFTYTSTEKNIRIIINKAGRIRYDDANP
jgi:prepilin-type N-terminal cleavage/methylation domain-containing protein